MKLFIPTMIAGVALTLEYANALNVKIFGCEYSPRKGPEWAADNEKCKSEDEVEKDMKALATITDKVRINSLLDCNVSSIVLPTAKKAGLQVHLGIWMSSGEQEWQLEKDQFSSLLKSGMFDKNIIAVDVGSQAISREQVDTDLAISQMKTIRDQIRESGFNTPVTIAETIDTYVANPKLIQAVDFVNVIHFPIWDRVASNEGASKMLDRLRSLRMTAALANKKTQIASTGWSSNGSDPNAATATPQDQARYLSDIHQMSVANDIPFYWYTYIDQPWRVKEIEANFGLFSVNNTLKSNIDNLNITLLDPFLIQNEATSLYLSESTNEVYMWEKSKEYMATEEQVWFWNPATQQLRCLSNFQCLDAYQPQDRGFVHMFPCIDTEGNQKWRFDNKTNQLQHITHNGLCLDIDTERSNRIQIFTCSNKTMTQKWDFIEKASAY
ncbi:ricin b lectin-like protein [Plasmopara halstedii]|uniref:glucan endo-1,3-beta-D-glucosidase n=1 Tax=Plasmopara halstedii TaxID=4781 RepID=A0A0P1AX22_PLAHL|nr:ricin b lectin-like protein [Plasmopara halstedii]CEG46028.1 ricin b lectin-like protein [Plasmopara halstedii]|eukprot:XP_024582397.1 ricin b lectin-like protein [Plasmopara halstedii]